jgi:phosphoribosylanthranilate isomerase
MNSVRTRIKMCGMTRVADALMAASVGADAVGLNFWSGTPRRVDVQRARDIANALPPFVTRVGLFVDPGADDVHSVLANVPIDVLQFHGAESPEFCRAFGRPYLKAVHVREGVDLLEYVSRYGDAAGLLFDTFRAGDMPGGTGHTFDWTRLSPAVRERLPAPLILSGGLDPDNVGVAIRAVRPWAVDVSSGVEERNPDGTARKGFKDAALVKAFVQGVRDADG